MIIILLLGFAYAMAIGGFRPRMPTSCLEIAPVVTTHIYEELC